jgi:tetratricopeptide (TPR) repeat protein
LRIAVLFSYSARKWNAPATHETDFLRRTGPGRQHACFLPSSTACAWSAARRTGERPLLRQASTFSRKPKHSSMPPAGTLFAEAKYQEALSKLAVAKKNLNNKPFEGIMFIEGACHFNLQDYPKAIETLEAFVKEFPRRGDHRCAHGAGPLPTSPASRRTRGLQC